MRNKDESITLKLGDFGLAVEVKAPIYTICGTPTYVAPEILSEIGMFMYIYVTYQTVYAVPSLNEKRFWIWPYYTTK